MLLGVQEEIMWRQRSRITRLREGDSNTKFFNQKASRRRAKNRIQRLNKSDGSVTENVDEMQGVARNFFFSISTLANGEELGSFGHQQNVHCTNP